MGGSVPSMAVNSEIKLWKVAVGTLHTQRVPNDATVYVYTITAGTRLYHGTNGHIKRHMINQKYNWIGDV